ncbi:hypothetical protein NHH03_23760 [Stieleria sp. TO1_6]|uniref:hypothetical protein n=1 Tax=Stieleria tagensis TaxID=2956795 RepID=UPI00209AD3CB|nr:hypothetical protein [Stieleria tagensis]MCO8124774.1 hypothetical protein [Stieleria tagensis]
MKRHNWRVRAAVAFTMAALSLTQTASIQAQQNSTPAIESASPGITAMQQAAQYEKYLFVYFWKQNDQQTQAMRQVFQNATGEMANVANAIAVQITDPKQSPIVKRFDVSRAPMPLVLAIAPNGAITKGLPVKFTERQLQDAVVSHGTATCLKALQDRKLVLLCVATQSGANPFQGVREFASDSRYAASSQIVSVDPTDPSEKVFLQSLKVDPAGSTRVAVVLAPPGQPVATFAEATSKAQIVERLTAAGSACCPGGNCGPGGQCGPGQQCAPGQKCGPNGCAPQE